MQHHPFAADPAWGEYPSDLWADAAVAAMKLGGVDYLFFVSGSELSFYQEAIAKAGERGWPAPRLITMVHEGVALNAAMGAAMVSGRPTATAAHVDVGTLNYGAGIHTAWRGGAPVLITAGAGPRAYPGSMPGSRESGVQWGQEPRDQGEIVRQYTKLGHRMEHQDNPGLMVSRLLQVAMSEPRGPAYLTFPQETALLPVPGAVARFPTRDQLGLARPAWPDPSDARQAARFFNIHKVPYAMRLTIYLPFFRNVHNSKIDIAHPLFAFAVTLIAASLLFALPDTPAMLLGSWHEKHLRGKAPY